MWGDRETGTEFPQRRKNRLSGIEYNENGAYFITICTRNRTNLFWNDGWEQILYDLDTGTALRRPPVDPGDAERPGPDSHVGAALRRPPVYLNANGIAVFRELAKFDEIYQGIVAVDTCVIMPNHVHLLLSIHPENANGRRNAAPTIPAVINQFKGSVTKRLGFPCWQKSFHDRVVRDEGEYLDIWEYIDNNPRKWREDRYCIFVDGSAPLL